MRALSVSVAGVSLAIAIAGCGGGGASSASPGASLPIATATPTPVQGSKSSSTSVKVTIAWPPSAASQARRRNYISASTKSVVIAVENGATVTVDNPALTGNPQSFTTANVGAPIGSDTFTVTDYSGADGTGSELAANTVVFDVIVDTANTLSLTLNGELASIKCVPISPFVSGTSPTFTQVGVTGQLLLVPEDAGNNVIIAPGNVPALALAPTTASQATITPASTTNEFNTNILVTGTPVPLMASGKNLEGTAVTTTCSITRDEALYVANNNQNGTQSVAIFNAAAATAATPVAILKGANTELTAIQFPAVDPQGNLYVTNEGPMPGATYGPNTGYISIYGPGAGQSGNQAPIAIMSGFERPEGVAFDAAGDLYVLSVDRINEYAPGLAAAKAGTPMTTITDTSANDLNGCYGLTVDTGGIIYAACSDEISELPKGSTGAATATEITLPLTTAASFQSDSWLSVAVDSAGEIYAPGFNQTQDNISGYMAGSSGASAATFTALGFSQPMGMFIDANGLFYVANFGNSSVDVFSSKTTAMLGPTGATSTLTSGVSYPYGVYAR